MFVNILKIIVGFCIGAACGIGTAICLYESKKDVVRRTCAAIAALIVTIMALIMSSTAVFVAEIVGFAGAVFIMPLAAAASTRDEGLDDVE